MQDLVKMAKKAIKNSLLATLMALGVSGVALAQNAGVGTWPTQKPIRLIAVFPPGGSVDQVARVLAPALQADFGGFDSLFLHLGSQSRFLGLPFLRLPSFGFPFLFGTLISYH